MCEIEKQFFEVFEIDNCRTCDYHGLECWECDDIYPQITDRILLELIGILAKKGIYLEDMDGLFKMKTYETSMVMQNADNLKDVILKTAETACRLSKGDGFKHQVQELFMEGI